jgi:DOPA 4,5-dioxygenase
MSITGYHAHIYYDAASRERAAAVRAEIETKFAVRMGRWRDEPVGPHPQSMYQVAFAPEVFAELVPWLMLNRRGLTILVHPETGDDVADHDVHPMWLGGKLALDIEALRRFQAGPKNG